MFEDLDLPREGLFAAVHTAYHRFAAPDLWSVEPTLGELAGFCENRGVLLFVTSNWDFRLPKILRDLGVEPLFREIITSASVGFEKPSEKIFRHLAAAAGYPPFQVLHVGDKIEEDVRGARGAGLQAVLYRKDGHPAEDHFPFVQVQSLRQIHERLRIQG
jgi:2-haloacid dehalogenase